MVFDAAHVGFLNLDELHISARFMIDDIGYWKSEPISTDSNNFCVILACLPVHFIGSL